MCHEKTILPPDCRRPRHGRILVADKQTKGDSPFSLSNYHENRVGQEHAVAAAHQFELEAAARSAAIQHSVAALADWRGRDDLLAENVHSVQFSDYPRHG